MPRLRYLLLQTRNPGDPMAAQEVRCFAKALECEISAISVFDLIGSAPSIDTLQQADMLLLGGSGHYSVATRAGNPTEPSGHRPHSPWINRTLDTLREIHRLAKPTFASCWGFQAMARAMGGQCVNDVPNAEVGTIELQLTDAGRTDPLFGALPPSIRCTSGPRGSRHRASTRCRAIRVIDPRERTSLSFHWPADLLHAVPSRARPRGNV